MNTGEKTVTVVILLFVLAVVILLLSIGELQSTKNELVLVRDSLDRQKQTNLSLINQNQQLRELDSLRYEAGFNKGKADVYMELYEKGNTREKIIYRNYGARKRELETKPNSYKDSLFLKYYQ